MRSIVSVEEREKLLQNIVLLRQAEQKAASAEVATVREDLEARLGGSVSRSQAAKVLGVSHTALNNWIQTGDVPVVITKSGRREVPISALLDLAEEVSAARRTGRRRLHTLEPVMVEARRRAERMRPRGQTEDGDEDPHRSAERRALAYHRALAPRLRRPIVDQAQRKLRRWEREGAIDPRYARAWDEILVLPMAKIRKAITADDQRGRDLRQNSPFAGLLSEPERRRILEEV
jgi:hypothetical protein